jgi:hypothetical protein
MITIKIEGLEELKRVFKGASEKVEGALKKAMEKSIFLIWRGAVGNIDKMTKTHSGFLKSRWGMKVSAFKSSLYPMVSYAPYVHEGTKAHIILPVIKKALFWKGARHPVKKVQHPGTTPRPFLLRAVESSIEKIKKFFKEEIETIFK